MLAILSSECSVIFGRRSLGLARSTRVEVRNVRYAYRSSVRVLGSSVMGTWAKRRGREGRARSCSLSSQPTTLTQRG